MREALLKERHNNDEGQQNERAAHAFSKLQQGYQHALIRVMSPSHEEWPKTVQGKKGPYKLTKKNVLNDRTKQKCL